MYDDFVHLYNVSNTPFLDAIRVTMGGHLIYCLTTVFWILKSLFGTNPVVFMLLAIALHLVSVRLLFEIVSRLTGKSILAALGASLWGMSPFVNASLEWISVHGHVYATTAILWVLLDVVRYSQSPSRLTNGLLVRHAFLLLVAATSFGSGLSSTVVFILVIAVWNPLPDQRNRLIAVYGAVTLLAIGLYALTLLEQPGANSGASFTRAMLMNSTSYISGVLSPLTQLLSIGFAGLLWGPLIIGKIALVPRDLLPSVATVVSVLVMLPFFLWGCVLSNADERRRIFALLLLPIAAYGLIAFARTAFLAQAQVVTTPRYHYLAVAILAIVICLSLSKLIEQLPEKVQKYGGPSFGIWLALAIVPFALAPAEGVKPIGRTNQEAQYKAAMGEIQAAIKNSAKEDTIYIENKPYRVTPLPMKLTPEAFPGFAALFVLSYPSNVIDGKSVMFLESSREIVEMTKAQKGTRISELLVYAPSVAK